MIPTRYRCLLALLAAVPLACGAAVRDDYPAKPLRFLVGFAPGGGTDTVARILAQKLGEASGQPVVVDNRAGAAGTIANELVARAAPDGYTLLFMSASFTIHPALTRRLAYDPRRDFAPVTLATSSPYVLALHPGVPAQSVRELIALAKAQPGKLNYASAGTGSTLHLAAELFRSMAGVDLVHVPYKGANGITDLLAGAVQLTVAGPPQTLPHVRAGRLRALGVTTARRSATLPELPTLAESGVPGYEVDSWYGVLAPAGTPATRIAWLNEALRRILDTADVKAKLTAQGMDMRGTTPDAFRDYLAAEFPKWAQVVRTAGIKPE